MYISLYTCIIYIYKVIISNNEKMLENTVFYVLNELQVKLSLSMESNSNQ